MKTLKVKLNKRVNNSYQILIEPGLFQKIPADLKALHLGDRYSIITDSNVRKWYGEDLAKNMRELGLNTTLISFQAGERQKTLSTIEKLANQMIQLGHTRKSVIIALGGGVVGDLAGFLASIYMRGIPFIQIPTSLIAMSDSSIGGKTGVDTLASKNMIGTFLQPKRIYMDPQLLSTLSQRQIQNGLAELLKHGLIRDKKILKWLEKHPEKSLEGHTSTLTPLLVRSCKVKGKIVQQDEHESYTRMLLNYGHSIGHAIEHASGYRLNHGEAIAIGMNLENRIAVERKLMKEKHYKRIETILKSLHLPTELPPKIDRKPILDALKHDKKNKSTEYFRFTLLRKPGKPIIVEDMTEKEVSAIL